MTVHEALMMSCINGCEINYNHWAVRRWLATQDEKVQDALMLAGGNHTRWDRGASTKAVAQKLIEILPKKTPDGVPITYTSVRAALCSIQFRAPL